MLGEECRIALVKDFLIQEEEEKKYSLERKSFSCKSWNHSVIEEELAANQS